MKGPPNSLPMRVGAGKSVPLLTAVHSVKGRVRLRVAALQARPDLKRFLEAELARTAGIWSASASTVTRTVLVCYDPDRPVAEVIGVVETAVGEISSRPVPAAWAPRRESAAPLPAN